MPSEEEKNIRTCDQWLINKDLGAIESTEVSTE